ncbi:hypothetical protein B484DRAFT_450040 [Ochromonadaceae sp. CCMP2298]|nr:hypothetical protein B484DRAFT_450040 [Ochromonadaceae sp. CCMP2298]
MQAVLLAVVALSLVLGAVAHRSTHSSPQGTQQILARTIKQYAFLAGAATACSVVLPRGAAAEAAVGFTARKPTALLERLESTEASTYKPGIKIKDFQFPQWFSGEWQVKSTFEDLYAPLGPEVMGGKPIYDRALSELHTALDYVVRFRPPLEGEYCVFDRYFNVKQMAELTMGQGSVRSSAPASDDEAASLLQLTVAPQAAAAGGSVFQISLLATDRVQNQPSEYVFETLERTRQTITPLPLAQGPPGPPGPPGLGDKSRALQKEIETITIYELLEGKIIGRQRTAVFFSSLDPRYALALAREPAVARSAIDIRTYSLDMRRA